MVYNPPSGKLSVNKEYASKQVVIINFYIDRFEVSQKLYKTIVGINLSFFRGEQRPVEKINWFEAMAYWKAFTYWMVSPKSQLAEIAFFF